MTFKGYGSCNQWIEFCLLGRRGVIFIGGLLGMLGWCFSSRPPESVQWDLISLFHVVSAGWPLWWKFFVLLFVTVKTGSGDRQPHKSASSLVNLIASSSECHCTGFSVPSFLFLVHVRQCIKMKSWFAMATSTSWTDAPENEHRGAFETAWLPVHNQDFVH